MRKHAVNCQIENKKIEYIQTKINESAIRYISERINVSGLTKKEKLTIIDALIANMKD